MVGSGGGGRVREGEEGKQRGREMKGSEKRGEGKDRKRRRVSRSGKGNFETGVM